MGLLQEGIKQSGKEPAVRVMPDGRTAIHHAIKNARKGELVVILADKVMKDIGYVQEFRDLADAKKAGDSAEGAANTAKSPK